MTQTKTKPREIQNVLEELYHKNYKKQRKNRLLLSDILLNVTFIMLVISGLLEFFWGMFLTTFPNYGMLALIICAVLLIISIVLLIINDRLLKKNNDKEFIHELQMKAMDDAMEELMKKYNQFSSKTSLLAYLLARYSPKLFLCVFADIIMLSASIYVIVKMPGIPDNSNIWMILFTVAANLVITCIISFMGIAIKQDSFRSYTLPEYIDWLNAKEVENREKNTVT